MAIVAAQPDTIRCKHCGEEIAQIPRAAVVGRFSLRCLHCAVVLVVWPPKRTHLDVIEKQVYTEGVSV